MPTSYSFTYTVLVPTSTGGTTGGTFNFTTGVTPLDPTSSGDVDFAVTGFSGNFTAPSLDDSPLVSASGVVGTGPGYVDGVNSTGVTFTTASGETVTLYNNFGVLSVKGTGQLSINDPVSGVSYNTNAPACFLRGTHIATPSGEVVIEDIQIGDMLVVGNGAARPVKWIGRRSYTGRLAEVTAALQPVRIVAGALGEGLPQRDLLVSGKHGMLLDGYLVAAEDLINGASIVRESGMSEIEYFHMEFDNHDVVVAEGCLSESFTEDGNRAVFHNAADYAALFPDEIAVRAEYCAPRLTDGPALEAIRARLDNGHIRLAA